MNQSTEESRRALNLVGLRSRLVTPAGPIARVDWLPQTGSTNADLAASVRQDLAAWPDLSVLTAEVQTAGKGRLERQWLAPEGSALAISVLLRPEKLPVEAFGWLSMLSAVAICQTLHAVDVKAGIKWPNDVLVWGADGTAKKICGILAQLVSVPGSGPAVVLGTGLNVSQAEAELPTDTSSSVLAAGGSSIDRNALLEDYLGRFAELYTRFTLAGGAVRSAGAGIPPLRQEVSELLLTVGQHVRAELPGGVYLYGQASGIDAHGALLLTDSSGTTSTVSAADVVHLRRADGQGIGYA